MCHQNTTSATLTTRGTSFKQQPNLRSPTTSHLTSLTPTPYPEITHDDDYTDNFQNYFRFELKCGNTSFVYEKNINTQHK